tara:strand:- start:3546 stop:3794 length:249 start_codon:yes stop_codon:yes gene_type:complete
MKAYVFDTKELSRTSRRTPPPMRNKHDAKVIINDTNHAELEDILTQLCLIIGDIACTYENEDSDTSLPRRTDYIYPHKEGVE